MAKRPRKTADSLEQHNVDPEYLLDITGFAELSYQRQERTKLCFPQECNLESSLVPGLLPFSPSKLH